VKAFEQGRLDKAIEHLGELDAIAPSYKDCAALLLAAQKTQDRVKSEVLVRLTQMRRRHQTINLEVAGSPGSRPPGAADASQGAEVSGGDAPFVTSSNAGRSRLRRFLAALGLAILALLVSGAAFILFTTGQCHHCAAHWAAHRH
jgi:hypothetical protein